MDRFEIFLPVIVLCVFQVNWSIYALLEQQQLNDKTIDCEASTAIKIPTSKPTTERNEQLITTTVRPIPTNTSTPTKPANISSPTIPLNTTDSSISTNTTTTTMSTRLCLNTNITHGYRLPKTLLPFHYTLILRPDIFTSFRNTGFVKIMFDCKEETDEIIMHMNFITVQTRSVQVVSENGMTIEVNSVSEDKKFELLVIKTSACLLTGNKYSVQMNFTGELNHTEGLYYTSYRENKQDRYLAITQFQATNARWAFPCFDEPAMKAKFKITLERRNDGKYKDYITLSNMPKLYSYQSTDGFVADVFRETVMMPTYLLAFAVCDYKHIGIETSKFEVRTYASKEDVPWTKFALEAGVKALQGFEDYFNMTFPLPKLDMIVDPIKSGAMENWGLITYSPYSMLYEPGVTTAIQQKHVALTVGHEISHMWFGNIITPQWWNDIWLNEAFAAFYEYVAAELSHPEWKLLDNFGVEVLHLTFRFDSNAYSNPIYTQKIETPEEIIGQFGSLLYYKGSCIVRMMWDFLGPETFRRGLMRYVLGKEYGNVNKADLWKALTEQINAEGKRMDIKQIMEPWIQQRNYPVIKVMHNSSHIHVTQAIFLNGEDTNGRDSSPYNYTWAIPFTYKTSVDDNRNLVLIDITEKEKTFPVLYEIKENSWILGNIEQMGYYRVNYDDANWRALINQLETDHTKIHPSNRAQIIDDVWVLAGMKQTSMTNAFNVLNYLDEETDYGPWKTALVDIWKIKTYLQTRPIYGKFEIYIRKKLNGIYSKVGMLPGISDTMNSRLLRSSVVYFACYFGHNGCTDHALKLFKDWLKNGKRIPADIKTAVICVGIRESRSDVWDKVFNITSSAILSDKQTILGGLGCSRDSWILHRYMEYALDVTKEGERNTYIMLKSVMENPIGLDIAWTYFITHWDSITKQNGINSYILKRVLNEFGNMFNTEYRHIQMTYLKKTNIKKHIDFDEPLSQLKTNIKWMEQHYDTMVKWLS